MNPDNEKKEARIAKFTDAKQKAITQAAIYRDAALFTASRLNGYKQASKIDFVEEHRCWVEFFENLYRPQN